MFKEDFIDFIRKDLNELNGLKITIENRPYENVLYNLLTPYIAYKNSLDEFNRVIAIYTRRESKQHKLLPFFIGLSSYYKTFEEIRSKSQTPSEKLTSLEIKMSGIKRLLPDKFSYLNKLWKVKGLSIKPDRNQNICLILRSEERIPNEIAPRIQDIIGHLKSSIEEYDEFVRVLENAQAELDSYIAENRDIFRYSSLLENSNGNIGINEIRELGMFVNTVPTAGVLLFTNKTKYRELLKGTKINGKQVMDHFPIAEIIIDTNGEIQVNQSNEVAHPVMYFCSLDYYAGWSEIIQSLDSVYVNTLIIDGFNELVKSKRNFNELRFKGFTDSIREAQQNNVLKDVYFFDQDTHFENFIKLQDYNLNPYPWLLNHLERRLLDSPDSERSANHTVISIQDDFGSGFYNLFKLISIQLKSKIRESRDDQLISDVLKSLKDGYSFLSRATSFYSESLRNDLLEYVKRLQSISEILSSVSLRNQIQKLSEFISESEYENNKIQTIRRTIITRSLKGRTCLLSSNINLIDRIDIQGLLEEGTECVIDFKGMDDDLTDIEAYDNLFVLQFYGEITRSIFLHDHCENQFVILNNKSELGYYKKCFRLFTPLISELSDAEYKLLLLNLEDREYLIDDSKLTFKMEDYITHEDWEEIPETAEIDNENSDQEEILDLSFLIKDIISRNETDEESSDNNSEHRDYLIFYFDDRILRAPQEKYYHVIVNQDSDSSRDHKVKAKDLAVGDQIFLIEDFNDDFEELLSSLKTEFPELNTYLEKADSWRIDLRWKYEQLGGYYSELQSYLDGMGISVSNPTVENWISGSTIEPELLADLYDVLSINPDSKCRLFDKMEVLAATKWLSRFRTYLYRALLRYSVYKEFGMKENIRELQLKDLVEKIHHNNMVEIKEILMIQ
ncbi:hypothetical protein SAMN04490243_1046 [Robiginitalea myxolifaciens]|uniref:DISARM protein DrmE C-terminal domain-containing protein n=1 Tax=Robiginitalea myxolifaciens TaxID=400055 RepID=A0A1I6G0V6_9FLAO|nr:hypothetical protein [Robiginitalea myxolifaciens]SFR35792.1 hypothetical protein SAMN04490243_1046 [Robiginitalea myxolifaciens]